MPIYEYICKNGHRTEEIYPTLEDSPELGDCPLCESDNVRIVSACTFKLGWVMTVNDEGAGKIWEGTPLEGTDGVNKLYYKAKNNIFDQGRVA